ncbi:hypothetical protein [Streptomyces anandii]|nr:hypothetical protein [Streptomyces anandii]
MMLRASACHNYSPESPGDAAKAVEAIIPRRILAGSQLILRKKRRNAANF